MHENLLVERGETFAAGDEEEEEENTISKAGEASLGEAEKTLPVI